MKKDFKEREDKDIDKQIALENQVKFNDKCSISFANPEYLKKGQWEEPCLYKVNYDKHNLANLFALESEETIRLAKESRLKIFLYAVLFSIDNIDEYSEMASKYLEKVEECERLETELSKIHKLTHDKSFAQLEKHYINLELALQNAK
ncbi:hypothetical protein Tco_0461450 [Tanacetum coccineum]